MAHEAAKAFPLAWPAGQPRARSRGSSKFRERSLASAFQELKAELTRLGAQYIVISTNVPLKANGEPYSDPGRMPDPGVATYFKLRGKSYALACDRWSTVEENIYALAKHIEAMRGMERWGVGSVEQTFAGFKQLTSESEPDWWVVLGLDARASVDQILAAHRAKAMAAHPDRGGTTEQMTRVNVARDRALKERSA
jgi:hypothetical protein